jgi:hypothetical protein
LSSGIIIVADEQELLRVVQNLSASDYSRRGRAIAVNIERAHL